tara:strand:- start:102 stop:953 length:852 start_codon:yes stop_codon:yes gene_type:complete
VSDIPQWFWDAVDQKPESHYVEVDEIDIHYQTWSDQSDSGLLFVHGHNAHAHWWDFIAPSFSARRHTVALDLGGMGDSHHRDEYSPDGFAREILAVADAAGMPADTTLVAHSFGGMMALRAVCLAPDRFTKLILVDSGVKHPDEVKRREPEAHSRPKVYPSFDVAKARFRLQPAQTCENEFLVEYIARNSVEHVSEGWVWKFDEELDFRMTGEADPGADLTAAALPVELIYGEHSESFSKQSAEYMQSLRPELAVYEMADAQHHLFLDQPLAFIEMLSQRLEA